MFLPPPVIAIVGTPLDPLSCAECFGRYRVLLKFKLDRTGRRLAIISGTDFGGDYSLYLSWKLDERPNWQSEGFSDSFR